ncbi:MAG TPA: oxygenase MpaB family protein [Acidimicrobiales bacterium]
MEPSVDPIEDVRLRLQRTLRMFLIGSDAPPQRPTDRDDPGLFGPDSVTWRVHADPSMFIAGLRALLIQTLHPLAMAGVAEHSDYRNDPLGRFQRTVQFVAVTTYGTTAEANAAIERIRRVHDHVTGIAPDGRPYAANDPHLLGWVHLTEVDSFLGAYQRYSTAPLTDAEADQYVAEMARLGRLIGAEDPPESVDEMQAALERFRPELRAGRQARDAVRFLLVPPFPLLARPAYGITAAAAVSLLPPWAQRMLWLPVAPGVEPLVVRPAATLLVRVLGWALAPEPPALRASA